MIVKIHHFQESDQELRARNLETVKQYMSMNGPRYDRYKLFVPGEEATAGVAYMLNGEERFMQGTAQIKNADAFNSKHFPDWTWTDPEIFETGDPNQFWVWGKGGGTSMLPGQPVVEHTDFYIHSFVMRDGKILHYREFRNPFKELKELGIPLPPPLVSMGNLKGEE